MFSGIKTYFRERKIMSLDRRYAAGRRLAQETQAKGLREINALKGHIHSARQLGEFDEFDRGIRDWFNGQYEPPSTRIAP